MNGTLILFRGGTDTGSLSLGVSKWRLKKELHLIAWKKILVSKPMSHRGLRRYAEAPGEMKRGDCKSLKWDHLGWAFFPQVEWDNISNTQVQNAACYNIAIALSPLTLLKYVTFQNAPLLCFALLSYIVLFWLFGTHWCCFVHNKTQHTTGKNIIFQAILHL